MVAFVHVLQLRKTAYVGIRLAGYTSKTSISLLSPVETNCNIDPNLNFDLSLV